MATIPTGIIGVLFSDMFSAMYLSLATIGCGFIITGVIMFAAERFGRNKKGVGEMKFGLAFFIGLCQGVAICPGISRSGATLFGGLIGGLDRKTAIKFAFLISIPSILGSAVMEAPNAFREWSGTMSAFPLILGVVVSAVSGFIAIKTMIRVVTNKKLFYFSIYTWILGLAVLVYRFILS